MKTYSVFLYILLPTVAFGAKNKGLKIIKDSEDMHDEFKDYSVEGKMILEDSTGSKSERELSLKVLEGEGTETDRSFMVFSKPLDIRGTAILTVPHRDHEDDQWLYLPALGRVKRIAASNKNGPFLGSEFSYDDLVPRVIEKYSYKFIKTRSCNKQQKCHVIRAKPKDKESPFSHYILWIESKNLLTYRVEYYNKRKKLVKTLMASDFNKHKDKHWAADKIRMTNKSTGKSTTFLYNNYEFGVGLPKRMFESNSLADYAK